MLNVYMLYKKSVYVAIVVSRLDDSEIQFDIFPPFRLYPLFQMYRTSHTLYF